MKLYAHNRLDRSFIDLPRLRQRQTIGVRDSIEQLHEFRAILFLNHQLIPQDAVEQRKQLGVGNFEQSIIRQTNSVGPSFHDLIIFYFRFAITNLDQDFGFCFQLFVVLEL